MDLGGEDLLRRALALGDVRAVGHDAADARVVLPRAARAVHDAHKVPRKAEDLRPLQQAGQVALEHAAVRAVLHAVLKGDLLKVPAEERLDPDAARAFVRPCISQ